MATKWANVKGILFEEEPRGPGQEGIVVVTFDVQGVPYTGGTDTITLGGGGAENGQVTTNSLATMIQNRRRDGRIVTLGQVMGGRPGRQLTATNGPDFYAQAAVISGGNVIGITLQSAPVGGSNVTTTTGPWDIACGLVLSYLAPSIF